MRQLVELEPDVTLEEIKQRLGLSCTIDAIHWVLSRLGLTYKKDASCGRAKPARHRQGPVPLETRPGIDRPRSACLHRRVGGHDEHDAFARPLAQGERMVCHAPHGHWRTTTMISSVRLDGTRVCMTIEGATNTEVFYAYVREVLVPSLR